MIAELISVGTEILLGNITNTNARFLAEECAKLGLSCYYQVSVGDNEERLGSTLRTALSRADVVILSGGLGPTNDDLTKEVTAKVLERPLVEDAHTHAQIQGYFEQSSYRTITENNWKQALIPEGAIVVDNHNGTAPGLIVEAENHKTVILLPGPPNELLPMFTNDIAPYLQKKTPEILYSKTVKISGMGESFVATQVKDLLDAQTNPTIAPYAKTGEVHLRITARAQSQDAAEEMIRPMEQELYRRFGDAVYTSREDVTLEDALIHMLAQRGMTLTAAESCTGGLLSGRLVNVSGASAVINETYVTYANDAKESILGVRHETLQQYGAVSRQTAQEMAEGAARIAHADAAVSVTGIAGPDGGTQEKPVGLVYIGCSIGEHTEVEECRFHGNRAKIREAAVSRALDVCRRCVLKYADG